MWIDGLCCSVILGLRVRVVVIVKWVEQCSLSGAITWRGIEPRHLRLSYMLDRRHRATYNNNNLESLLNALCLESNPLIRWEVN